MLISEAFEGGIIGHEFVGVLEEFSRVMHPSDVDLMTKFDVGQRVVGEINVRGGSEGEADDDAGSGVCGVGCAHDRARNHWPNRTVLGIMGKSGTFAQCVAGGDVVPTLVLTFDAGFVPVLGCLAQSPAV
jgi:hypothetical protein